MKNWNEIEQRLKNENTAAAPAGLHDQIMRAVRDDRAATTAATPDRQRHFASYWLMGGAFGIAVVAMIALPFILPPIGVVEGPAARITPSIALPDIEAFATTPIHTEIEALRADLVAATLHIASYFPSPNGG